MKNRIGAALISSVMFFALTVPFIAPVRSVSHNISLTTAALPTPLKILAMGDSITTKCELNPISGWCSELQEMLTNAGVETQFHAVAQSGVSCGWLSDNIIAALDTYQPHLVIFSCGTNNDTSTQAARDTLGTQIRLVMERTHSHQPYGQINLIGSLIQYSNPEIQTKQGRVWLIPSEGRGNDVIYTNLNLYLSWPNFLGMADLQIVPGSLDYLLGGTDGIHPNLLGYHVYAHLYYEKIAAYYGLPVVQRPCGLHGHRDIYEPYAGTVYCAPGDQIG